MEKVQAGSLTEEFSFSRALHLMKNNNAKVRLNDWENGKFVYVKNGHIVRNDGTATVCFSNHEMMGNWTLYDERIHG